MRRTTTLPGLAALTGSTAATAAETARAPAREPVERRLAAIMALDIKGYSLLMGSDDANTHQRVGQDLKRFLGRIHKHGGRVFSFSGDGLTAEFASAVQALKCALSIQAHVASRNAGLVPAQRIEYRIGINSGDVVVQGDRTGGDAVNIAARLEQMGRPGSLYISQMVYDQVGRIVSAAYECLGEHYLKNIAQTVTVYAVGPPGAGQAHADTPPARRGAAPASGGAAWAAAPRDFRPSIAVLPFRTLRGDEGDAYFAEGMVDDIIRALGGMRELLVISRSSTLLYAGSAPAPDQVGQELDVRYVLRGSVRRSATWLRVSTELWETEPARLIWANRFDGGPTSLFDLQDHIAIAVAGTIAPQVRARELRRAMRKHPASLSAYDLLLQALDRFFRLEQPTFRRARELLASAIAQDTDFAPAHSYAAYWHLVNVAQGWSDDPARDVDAAAQAAAAALLNDSTDALALAIYGHVQSFLLKEYQVAADYLARAVANGPSCALAWTFSSATLGYLGDATRAIEHAREGLRLSPLAPDVWQHEHILSQALYLAGDYEQAIAWARKAATHNGALTSNLRVLAASLVASDQIEEAHAVGTRLRQLNPDFSLADFARRTPLHGDALKHFIARLRVAGLPD